MVGFDVDLDELWDFVILEFCNKTHTIQYGYDTGRDHQQQQNEARKMLMMTQRRVMIIYYD